MTGPLALSYPTGPGRVQVSTTSSTRDKPICNAGPRGYECNLCRRRHLLHVPGITQIRLTHNFTDRDFGLPEGTQAENVNFPTGHDGITIGIAAIPLGND